MYRSTLTAAPRPWTPLQLGAIVARRCSIETYDPAAPVVNQVYPNWPEARDKGHELGHGKRCHSVVQGDNCRPALTCGVARNPVDLVVLRALLRSR